MYHIVSAVLVFVFFFPLGCISLNPASFVRHSYEQEEFLLLLFCSSEVVIMPSHNCHAMCEEKSQTQA
jgi:hypothetical protein